MPVHLAHNPNGAHAVFQNYFSFGHEAASLFAFHMMREAHPARFNGRIKNQALMVRYGFFSSGCCGCVQSAPQLAPIVRLDVRKTADGGWEPLVLPHKLKAVVLANIPSHSAGRNPWGGSVSSSDALIEVCGIAHATHGLAYLAGSIPFGTLGGPFRLIRLAKVAELRLETLEPLHMQVDGEPWLQPPGCVRVSHFGTTPMLQAPTAEEVKSDLRHNF